MARHERLPGKSGARLDLDHYLEALVRKPGALPGSTALEQGRAAGKFTPVHDAWWAAARRAHGDAAWYPGADRGPAAAPAIFADHVTSAAGPGFSRTELAAEVQASAWSGNLAARRLNIAELAQLGYQELRLIGLGSRPQGFTVLPGGRVPGGAVFCRKRAGWQASMIEAGAGPAGGCGSRAADLPSGSSCDLVVTITASFDRWPGRRAGLRDCAGTVLTPAGRVILADLFSISLIPAVIGGWRENARTCGGARVRDQRSCVGF